jgi:hypothetical protein
VEFAELLLDFIVLLFTKPCRKQKRANNNSQNTTEENPPGLVIDQDENKNNAAAPTDSQIEKAQNAAKKVSSAVTISSYSDEDNDDIANENCIWDEENTISKPMENEDKFNGAKPKQRLSIIGNMSISNYLENKIWTTNQQPPMKRENSEMSLLGNLSSLSTESFTHQSSTSRMSVASLGDVSYVEQEKFKKKTYRRRRVSRNSTSPNDVNVHSTPHPESPGGTLESYKRFLFGNL